MLDKARQRPKSPRGGRRPGAGRPPKGERAGSPHKRRQAFKASQPIHVVLRVVKAIGNLRRRAMYRALRGASLTTVRREDFRIVHVSIQRSHVHLLVEAEHKPALARGMQGFQISAAKLMNAELVVDGVRRRGQVFADRYHAEIITTPRQARHTLAYVLNNWRKHKEDRASFARGWKVDPFSTGVLFGGWTELEGELVMWKWREGYQPMVVWTPRTWLLREGWRRHGLIRCDEVPGSAPGRRSPRAKLGSRHPARARSARPMRARAS
jgi:REP element-mobilizing transposase RayT